jgi:diguanylate cyclase (GGDEF)-like protein
MKLGSDKTTNLKKIFTFQNVIILASLIPIIIFGFLTYNSSKDDDLKNSFAQIQNINRLKNKVVQDYFDKIKFDLVDLSKTVSFLEKQTSQNIANMQALQKSHIQDYYNLVQNNILSLAKKDMFQYIFSFKNRDKNIKKEYMKGIYQFKEELGIKNVLMINKQGKILYSSDQKELIGTNITQTTKPFNDIWPKVKLLRYSGKKSIRFVNFGYEKLSKTYKHFAISPFKDVDGFIAIEIDQTHIQKIIEHVTSLGTTAETYLTYRHKDKTFLATNRVVKKGKIGQIKDGEHIQKGFNFSGVDIKYGSLGDIEIVGYMPVVVKNLVFSMQTTVAYTEVISPVIKGANYFEQFIADHNYQNILFVGTKGDIFYSAKKNDDDKINIFDTKYENNHLAKAVRKVFTTKKLYITDIDFYEQSPNKLAQFAAIPILDSNQNIQSVALLQLNLHTLTKKLALRNKVHKSLETYIVGQDKRLRTDTLLEREKFNILDSFEKNILMDTDAVKDAFSLASGSKILKDYRNKSVLCSFSTVKYSDFKWAVITKIDASEIDLMLSGLRFNILLFVFISSIVALIVMAVITNEKKSQDKKLIYNATHDSLTQLPNRKFALEFLSYRLANSKRVHNKGAVLFIDLDRFKLINDSYGHKVGDHVLKEVALRLKKVLREDDLLARLGGDEFILIVNDFENLHNLDALCKKVIANVSQPIEDYERSYKINLSIGIAVFPDDGDTPAELLQYADTAMFKTKEAGRNGYTYYSKEMTDKSLQISRVESDLKKAIENDELVLHYQPQIDLKENRIVGVEALVRWNHPKDGLVMPNDFIPIAEDSSLIIDLGTWVTKKACQTFKSWKERGYELDYIAVNMSAKQIQCPVCVENLKNMLKEINFNTQWLELEITENVLISNLESTLTNINSIKDMGIRFSIDDFGTGYSSLSYLKSLPISTLKIDRAFIKDILTNKDDLAIVSAIIAIGHTLNYEIIAEGTEEILEVELLRTLGCNMAQGYYYSKPLPEKELLQYFNTKPREDGNIKC